MDLQILQWINENLHSVDFFNHLFKWITYLGETGIGWIVFGLILLCFKKTRKGGFIMLASLFFGAVINNLILKPLVARPRPFVTDPTLANFITSIGYELPTGYSFPSGHTQVSINCAVVLTFMFGKKGAWSFIPAVLISISRVFLCVHYTTDVLCGALIGTIVAILFSTVGKKVLNMFLDWFSKKYQEYKTKKQQENSNAEANNENN